MKTVTGFATQEASGQPSGLMGELIFRALW
jgi:hypothetical protein